uniref:Uncharacterized protein n=1 Tax=Plectus sambesii TaxID=2011161 RepID=A0A914UJ21_9BILA
MKVLLVTVSLFVYVIAKKNHGKHKAHDSGVLGHANNAAQDQTNVDLHECFKKCLLTLDFNAPPSDIKEKLNTVCPGQAEAMLGFVSTHKKAFAALKNVYEKLSEKEKADIKVNQTKSDAQGIVAFVRSKIATTDGDDKKFNKMMEQVFKPYVEANLKKVVEALGISEEKKQLKEKLINDRPAAVQFLKEKLAAANLTASDPNLALVQGFINEINSV